MLFKFKVKFDSINIYRGTMENTCWRGYFKRWLMDKEKKGVFLISPIPKK
jgi:hypothetical protein